MKHFKLLSFTNYSFLIALFTLSFNTSLAQQKLPFYLGLQNRTTIRLDFLSVGVGFETGITDKITIRSQVAMFPSIAYSDADGASILSKWSIQNTLRYYHNLNKRTVKGKNINDFAANYFAVELRINIDDAIATTNSGIYGYRTHVVSVQYGWQRNIGKNFYWDGNLGPGYFWQGSYSRFHINFYFGLGFKL